MWKDRGHYPYKPHVLSIQQAAFRRAVPRATQPHSIQPLHGEDPFSGELVDHFWDVDPLQAQIVQMLPAGDSYS